MSKVHKFVITNPDLCIACNACMKTCIKHAYMRGKLSKKRLDVLTLESGKMPNQCRQCDDLLVPMFVQQLPFVSPIRVLSFAKRYVSVVNSVLLPVLMGR